MKPDNRVPRFDASADVPASAVWCPKMKSLRRSRHRHRAECVRAVWRLFVETFLKKTRDMRPNKPNLRSPDEFSSSQAGLSFKSEACPLLCVICAFPVIDLVKAPEPREDGDLEMGSLEFSLGRALSAESEGACVLDMFAANLAITPCNSRAELPNV